MFPQGKLKAKLLHGFLKISFKLSGKFSEWEKGVRRDCVTKLTQENDKLAEGLEILEAGFSKDFEWQL